MRKFIILFAVVVLIGSASAQRMGFSFGGGAGIVTPAGDFSDRADKGWGVSAQAKFGLPIITVTGAMEYLAFGDKEISGVTNSTQMWGFNVGGHYTLLPFLYIGAEIGTYKDNSKITRGSAAPIIGVEFLSLDLSARYVYIDNTDFTSIRLTYWF